MSKFDVNELPTNMLCYYVNGIKEWSRLSSLSVGKVDDISAESLWYSKEIKIGFKTVWNENLFSIGMWYVGGLFDEGNLLPRYKIKDTTIFYQDTRYNHLIHGCVVELMEQMSWHGVEL